MRHPSQGWSTHAPSVPSTSSNCTSFTALRIGTAGLPIGGNSFFTAGGFRFAFKSFEEVSDLVGDLSDEEKASMDVPLYTEDNYYDDLMRVTEDLADADMALTLARESQPTHNKDLRLAILQASEAAGAKAEPSASLEQLVEALGVPSAVVNNAGLAPIGPVDAITSEELLRTMGVNVGGAINVVASLRPHLRTGLGEAATKLAKGCPVIKGGAQIAVYETFNVM